VAFSSKRMASEFFYDGPCRPVYTLRQMVHPGLMTDCSHPLSCLSKLPAPRSVHETVYENRLATQEILRDMARHSLFKQCLGGKLCVFQPQLLPQHAIKRPNPSSSSISPFQTCVRLCYLLAALISQEKSTIIRPALSRPGTKPTLHLTPRSRVRPQISVKPIRRSTLALTQSKHTSMIDDSCIYS